MGNLCSTFSRIVCCGQSPEEGPPVSPPLVDRLSQSIADLGTENGHEIPPPVDGRAQELGSFNTTKQQENGRPGLRFGATTEGHLDEDQEVLETTSGDPRDVPPPQVQAHRTHTFNAKRMFIVTIGIDEYQDRSLNTLQGAVADADSVEKFFTSKLGVPPNNIKRLRNQEATGDKIKSTVRSLASDRSIQWGDPIIIYYAGHGSEAKTPEEWQPRDEQDSSKALVQMLLPHDFVSNPNPASSTLGQGIVDRTLSGLLRLVASVKGSNIVVILDSCHSSSATRSLLQSEDEGMVYRHHQLPADYRINPKIDGDLSGNGLDTAHSYREMESHVLLAACRSDERAGEFEKRGNFTSILLEHLSKLVQVNALGLTSYHDLILGLPRLKNWKVQHPCCEGTPDNVHRALFRQTKAPLKPRKFPISFQGGTPFVAAGTSSPITEGAEFRIMDGVKEISTATIDVPGVFRSPMRLHNDHLINPSETYHAEQTKEGKAEYFLSVFAETALLEKLRAHDGELSDKLPNISFAPRIEHADIAIVVQDGSVRLKFVNLSETWGLDETIAGHDSSISMVISVLEAASHFFLHLKHFGESKDSKSLSHKISVDFRRVESYDEENGDAFHMTGPNVHQRQVIQVIGSADLTVSQNSVPPNSITYGFRITNNSSIPLYMSVFFFSGSDLQISCWYYPTVDGDENPCLLPGGHVSVGCDDTRTSPYTFIIPPGRKNDVGFLKLFLSTEKVDLSRVARDSPFRSYKPRGDVKYFAKPTVWGGFCIPVIQEPPQVGSP